MTAMVTSGYYQPVGFEAASQHASCAGVGVILPLMHTAYDTTGSHVDV
jgi:hypothetical protein